jgi:hypothetical protein
LALFKVKSLIQVPLAIKKNFLTLSHSCARTVVAATVVSAVAGVVVVGGWEEALTTGGNGDAGAALTTGGPVCSTEARKSSTDVNVKVGFASGNRFSRTGL